MKALQSQQQCMILFKTVFIACWVPYLKTGWDCTFFSYSPQLYSIRTASTPQSRSVLYCTVVRIMTIFTGLSIEHAHHYIHTANFPSVWTLRVAWECAVGVPLIKDHANLKKGKKFTTSIQLFPSCKTFHRYVFSAHAWTQHAMFKRKGNSQ